jgi:hypothetical protein
LNDINYILIPVFPQCANWADADGGLSYRFGYTVSGGDSVVDFDWNSSPSVDMRLPTGTIFLAAQVKDALGAVSEIMYSSVTIGAGPAGRRRLLAEPLRGDGREAGGGHQARRLLMQSSFDWPGAAALLDEQLLAGNFNELNNIASGLILEVDSQFAGMNLTGYSNPKPQTPNPKPYALNPEP